MTILCSGMLAQTCWNGVLVMLARSCYEIGKKHEAQWPTRDRAIKRPAGDQGQARRPAPDIRTRHSGIHDPSFGYAETMPHPIDPAQRDDLTRRQSAQRSKMRVPMGGG